MNLMVLGQWMMVSGVGLTVLGGLVWLAGRFVPGLGQLPGDVRLQVGNVTVFFPIVTMIVLSVGLTVVVNVVLWVVRMLGRGE